jgi:hypothetical protein
MQSCALEDGFSGVTKRWANPSLAQERELPQRDFVL